ncbi:hypothetical protein DSM03_10931 [Leeuwenhoekiella aestuarii]|uniref:Flavoprotein n=1 Tax=Leeuwenhoekiella aestuarii TaxID=2249426 RepID=A0A4Q0NNX7_9FLAO|nr:NAD(P)/FAD-dependent oxidoreductase [Leeuwenhoekiella aestuarii]RXG11706.1 hypothetical protein DSM04_10931 [Leeuwenhoekiella aestuarii]RXG12761.1 hypothetical protein DSM03_10931 [Leeuwenhoekiella aestuarii]
MIYDSIIIGGGAAGFFTAINLAKNRPGSSILILERGGQVLEKVRVSGGGRCNVTHAVFEPRPLTDFYPRGKRELLGPFHTFMTGDTMAWFEDLGIPLKIEEDGRVFPQSDSSQSIIDCFLEQASHYNIAIETKIPVTSLKKNDDNTFELGSKNFTYLSRTVVVATGSNPKMLKLLEGARVKVTSTVPSLFTFNIRDERITSLAGLATQARVKLLDLNKKSLLVNEAQIDHNGTEGPVLITHWGMSGPGILKLSAWGARTLKASNYEFLIEISWLPDYNINQLREALRESKFNLAKQTVAKWAPFDLPKRLWQSLVKASGISDSLKWADLNKAMLNDLEQQLLTCHFRVSGKSTFKEEFVTAGGVDLTEIDFKTYQSKKIKGLYMVGEVLNIDAVTGGFNFQNAWTGGFIAAKALAESL